MFPNAEVMNTSGQKASGDFIVKRIDRPSILFENKEYDYNILTYLIEKYPEYIYNRILRPTMRSPPGISRTIVSESATALCCKLTWGSPTGSKLETTRLVERAEPVVHLLPSWRTVHFMGFFTGGTFFIAGTACYFFPNWVNGSLDAALLYIIGSFGFLTVDLLEFFTFVEEPCLRTNIALSAIGSLLYIIGSVGWLPQIMAQSQVWGIWGFILGSFFITVSQAWKVHRIGSNGRASRGFHVDNIMGTKEQFTAAGVEAGAGLGALCFLIGTLMYYAGCNFTVVLWIWIAGSSSFTIGSLFLGYRHAAMKL
jgi:hypothetical protein